MNDLDIFIDLESLGIGSPLYRIGEGGNIDALFNKLPVSLAEEGYQPRIIWGTACVKRKSGRLPGRLQIALKTIFVHHGGVVVWTEDIADNALKREVQRLLLGGELAQTVLLIACDHDFCPLVEDVVGSGRLVIVSGNNVSRRLANVASRVIPLKELAGEGEKLPIAKPSSLPNPILLP